MASDSLKTSEPIRFGDDFELDLRSYELRRSGVPLKLERIPMELLMLLIERRSELVSREQIIERIWGKDVFLDTDNSINAAIRKIRQVLKDDPDRPHFIQTVTGRGYRFVAPVEEPSLPPAQLLPAPEQSPSVEHFLGKKVSHYRVLQFLGGGGMGVVYKAEDLKLGRQVALKFLPSELATDPRGFERFEREARAASALDHPNICSIYELGEHQGQPFIVMQLLEGRTLREWIEKPATEPTGLSSTRLKQLQELADQILDGLGAAHDKGIIHRDIKPANIFITNRGQGKILDFGVAKFVDAIEMGDAKRDGSLKSDATSTRLGHLTHTGASIGTPSYLSPEQIRREKLDARTDLFSFGLVLYEMATGRRAFSGDTVTVIRDAVLNLPPAPVRQVCPEIPVELERIISKSLEKDRDLRYQSAQEMRADLVGLSAAPLEIQTRPRRTWMWVAAGLALLILALVAFDLGWIRRRFFQRAPSAESLATPKPRPSVAVIGFRNLSGKGEEAWISTALAEMLGAELAAGQQVRVVPSEDVARMRLDLSLPVADTYGRETLNRIRSHLSTDMVVGGSYLALGREGGGKVRIEFQLQSIADGDTLAVISRDGLESDLADLVSQGGASLRQKLGIGDLAPVDAGQVHSALPANAEAARLYAEGLTKLQNFDALGARDLLQKAVAADPGHALSHAALARSWSALGYDAKALAEAKKALDLSEHLSREDRLTVEGRYRILNHDYPSAIEIYRTLYNFFPDRIDYGLGLAGAQGSAGQDKDSLATIARIQKSGIPGASDGAVDLVESKTLARMSNFAEQQKVSAAAAEKGRAQGAPMLVAEALLREGWAWDDLGNTEKARAELTEARELSQSRNPSIAVWADLYLGHVSYDKGDFDAAISSYQQSLEGARKTGDQMGAAHALEGIANAFLEQGKLEEAKRIYEKELRINREIESKTGVASALGNLGNLFDDMGDLDRAVKTDEETAQAYRDIANRRGEATALANGGNVLIERGELAAAKSKLEQAVTLQQQIAYKRGLAYSLYALAEIARLQDRLDDTRKTAEQALALRKEIGDESNIARSQVQLAQIAIDQDRAAEAASLASAAVDVFHRLKSTDDEVLSYSVLTRALLAQAKTKDAQSAADRAVSLVQKSNNRSVRLNFDLAAAEVDMARGKGAEARKALEAVVTEAGRHGYLEFEYEARLGLGKNEVQSGNRAAGRKRLQQLHDDARAKNFLLIARKATASLDATAGHS